MGSRGIAIDETVRLPVTGVLAGTAHVQAAVHALPDYQVRTVSPGVLEARRTYRPTWALVAAIVLALPTLGLGLALLVVRTTETCVFEVTQARVRGTIAPTQVRIMGRLSPSGLTGVLAALAATSAGSAPAEEYPTGPSRPREPHQRDTAALPVPITPPSGPPPMPAPSDRVQLHFDTGEVAAVASTGLAGREPRADPEFPSAVLVTVPDTQRSVSKTHFAFGPRPGGCWVQDLGSTNGTTVILPDGRRVDAPAGRPVDAPLGSRIEFGDRRATVA